jgi:hypothetical protein
LLSIHFSDIKNVTPFQLSDKGKPVKTVDCYITFG